MTVTGIQSAWMAVIFLTGFMLSQITLVIRSWNIDMKSLDILYMPDSEAKHCPTNISNYMIINTNSDFFFNFYCMVKGDLNLCTLVLLVRL